MAVPVKCHDCNGTGKNPVGDGICSTCNGSKITWKHFRVVISAGHHNEAQGAVNKNLGLIEHVEACKMVGLLYRNLHELGYEVLRVGGTLREKVIGANQYNPMAAVEVHFNAGGGHGTETLYGSNPKDMKLAECVQVRLVEALNLTDRGIKFDDYAGTPGVVDECYWTRKIEQPSIIVEPLFIDHEEEAALLLSPATHHLIAEAVTQGIIDFLLA